MGVVDFSVMSQTPWMAMPDFIAPEFNINAILFMIPVAIAPAIEHHHFPVCDHCGITESDPATCCQGRSLSVYGSKEKLILY